MHTFLVNLTKVLLFFGYIAGLATWIVYGVSRIIEKDQKVLGRLIVISAVLFFAITLAGLATLKGH